MEFVDYERDMEIGREKGWRECYYWMFYDRLGGNLDESSASYLQYELGGMFFLFSLLLPYDEHFTTVRNVS